MATETKAFDCVEMKRESARQIREELKDATLQQELQYWQKQHRELVREQKKLIGSRQKKKAPPKAAKVPPACLALHSH